MTGAAPLGMGAAPFVTGAGAGQIGTAPAAAVRDFEALFVETLLQHSGLAQALDGSGNGAEGGMAGELMVRELARGLAEQLQLGFGRYLGVGTEAVTQTMSDNSSAVQQEHVR